MASILKQLIGHALDDKYLIEEQLGQGGMGAVFLATHLGTRRPVAVKVIAPQYMAQPEFVERFRREAEAAGRLRHPNVVNVTDFGFAHFNNARLAYLVMEYLDGRSLARLLKEEGRLPLAFTIDIIEQVCSAIAEAHEHGIIHRDLKPDNIWLEPNRRGGYTVKVLDFGLAKLRDSANVGSYQWPATVSDAPTLNAKYLATPGESLGFMEADTRVTPSPDSDEEVTRALPSSQNTPRSSLEEVTRAGAVMGTPHYMSPEQCRGEALDARADIYSIGAITYQMLTGQTPFSGDLHSLIEQHTRSEARPVRELQRDINNRVSKVVMSALAKDPAHRPASAAAFASTLRAQSEGVGTIMRQGLALYGQHFHDFLRFSLILHIPYLAVSFIFLASAILKKFNHQLQPRAFADIAFVEFLLFSLIAFSNFLIEAVLAPMVLQLLLRPLSPIKLRPFFAIAKKRAIPLLVTSILYMIICCLGLMLFIVPGVIMFINYSLCAPIVFMENKSSLSALKRSKELVVGIRRVLIPYLLFTLLIVTIPDTISQHLVQSIEGTFGFVGQDISYHLNNFLFSLLSIVFNPFVSIVYVLLYFKARQTKGETLSEAMQQVEESMRAANP